MSENGKTKDTSAKQVKDAELKAMHEITEILGDLGSDQQRRVMRWMADRYDPLPEGAVVGVPQL